MHAIAAARRLSGDRPLAALVGANAISSIGDWLYLTILPVLVLRQTGDLVLVGIVGALRLAPWLLLSVPAGIVVDRVRPERLLLLTESTRAALMLLLAGLTVTSAPTITLIVTVTAAVAVGTFAMPAHGRLIPMLAQDDDALGTANAVNAALDNVACIIGPMLAALVLVASGPAVGLVVNGLSFVLLTVILIGVGRAVRSRAARAGTRTDVTSPGSSPSTAGLIGIGRAAARWITIDAAVSFAAGALWLLPVIVTAQVLDARDATVALLGVLAGVGGIAGAASAAARVNRAADRGILVGLACLATALVACAAGASPIVAIVAVTTASAALVAVDTLNLTQLQRATDPCRLGRTLGILHASAAAWASLGSLAVSLLVPRIGFGPTCVLVGIVVGLIGVAPSIRAAPRALARRWTARGRPATSGGHGLGGVTTLAE